MAHISKHQRQVNETMAKLADLIFNQNDSLGYADTLKSLYFDNYSSEKDLNYKLYDIASKHGLDITLLDVNLEAFKSQLANFINL